MCVSRPLPGARPSLTRTFFEVAGCVFLIVFMWLCSVKGAGAQSVVAVHESGDRGVSVQADLLRPIASVTKVMTALLVAEAGLDEARLVTVTRADGSRRLRPGTKVSVGDLLRLMLVASDNGAANLLARTTHGSIRSFVGRMNARAQGLGLPRTTYVDPSGLGAGNVSTAAEQARLLRFVVSQDWAELLRLPTWTARVGRRSVTVRNTNRLLRDPGLDVVAGKTGTTKRAGYCLATVIKTDDGEEIAVVVLGARRPSARFNMARDAFRTTGG